MLLGIFDSLWWIWKRLGGYIKFNVVGAIGAVINFGLLYLLTDELGIWYMLSATIAIVVANSFNYTFNHLWTFRHKRETNPNLFLGWLKFLFTVGAVEVVYLGLVYLFTDICGFHYMLSAFFALALTSILRYIIADRWIWRKVKTAEERLTLLERLERGIGR